ncbi:MAG: PIG-L family deacetylase [Pigmentiphaga sp.]|uniref:PIG-L deacetylase family protein n=1 Tax=Pigmentiphaga sp. TaxID=1977564 RepID=UPI0029B12BBC|nr:PIG-L family deacetylase [Pigmentiphaga sp.]MDX3907854.1 PIG-L family deacetylase [Pigmentiphaga sp.]
MKSLDTLDRLTVVSPHLDDAVFSCGALLERARSCQVITVFAGFPGDVPLTDWDRRCGFLTAEEAVRMRREEDAAALAELGAKPVWLDLLDAQYGGNHPPEEVAQHLAPLIDRFQKGALAVPLGLFHSDHILTHEACMRLYDEHQELRWLFYEDALYRRLPGLLQQRLAELLQKGLRLTPVAGPRLPPRAKERAVSAYASQLRAFGKGGYEDTALPERYWKVDAHEPH